MSGYGKYDRGRREEPEPLDTSKIVFVAPVNPELFNSTAHDLAKKLASSDKNKPAQIRKFYDELVMWETKVAQSNNPSEKLNEYLPFIRMLNAKAAYAQGRNHTDKAFTDFISHSLGKVTDTDTLRIFKLFFEATLGFFKLYKKD